MLHPVALVEQYRVHALAAAVGQADAAVMEASHQVLAAPPDPHLAAVPVDGHLGGEFAHAAAFAELVGTG
ncbi:MAG: hypothetical protein M5U09_17850 [Gammaproteobacteria bacterium]|nr:hypothetical protein [Gammaproteobacteria bacterium]